jgi:hypothetical protein
VEVFSVRGLISARKKRAKKMKEDGLLEEMFKTCRYEEGQREKREQAEKSRTGTLAFLGS